MADESALAPSREPDASPSGPVGHRCVTCGYASLLPQSVCAACGADVEEEKFGVLGTVWSVTRVHVDVPGLDSPYGLAYVDLDGDGPRLLATFSNEVVQIGDKVHVERLGDRWAVGQAVERRAP